PGNASCSVIAFVVSRRRRHTRSYGDWSSDVCSSDLAYWAQVLRHHQSTDDAYVGGNVVQITPQISGTVVAIGADDTQFVKAGEEIGRASCRGRSCLPCGPGLRQLRSW